MQQVMWRVGSDGVAQRLPPLRCSTFCFFHFHLFHSRQAGESSGGGQVTKRFTKEDMMQIGSQAKQCRRMCSAFVCKF